MNNTIKIQRIGKDVKAGLVTSAFLRKANVFGTPEFQMIEEFIRKYPNAEVKTLCKMPSWDVTHIQPSF